MKTLLTKPDIEFFMMQQKVLDANIRENKGITIDDWQNDFTHKHHIALDVEMGEFINECHDIWKYWKDKPVNLDRILDEAVDVIHFVMLISIKEGSDSLHINHLLQHTHANWAERDVSLEHLFAMHHQFQPIPKLYIVLMALDHYGFTAHEIVDGYVLKNKENHRRVRSGY